MNFEARFDLRGCLEDVMTSKANKIAVRGKMHMDTKVIKGVDFKSEVHFDF